MGTASTANTLEGLSKGDALFSKRFNITRSNLVAYANASGDQNPIHQDDAAAKAAGLPGVIAHGMYTMGLAARSVSEWLAEQNIDADVSNYTGRFAKPVVVDAETGGDIEVEAKVRSVDSATGILEIALVVTHEGNRVVAPARATVTLN